MKVSLEKKAENEGLITINLEEKDYKEAFNNKLKEYSKKMNLKGFRPGKVPIGLVNKMYGKSIKADEINHKASHGLEDFIKKEKLQFVGDPMLVQPEEAYDFESQKDFEIKFELGLIPEYSIPLDKKIKVNKYSLKEDKGLYEETLENLRNQFGERSEPESSSDSDTVYGELKSKDESFSRTLGIAISDLDKKGQAFFTGKKKDDVVEFPIDKAFGKDKSALIGKAGLSETELKGLKGDFIFRIDSISKIVPAEINQDLFDKVFGKDQVKSKEEFETKLKEDITKSNEQETISQFHRDIRKALLEKTKLELSKDFMKRWLKQGANPELEINEEQLEKELPEYLDHLKWNLISNKIREDENIEVKPEEVKEETKKMIASQFGGNLPGDRESFLDQFADNYLNENEGKNFGQVYNSIMERRIFDYLDSKVTAVEKKVSHKEFKKVLAG